MSDSLRAPVPVPVEYPYSDGQPIGETPIHRDCIVHTIRAFQEVFAERPDVYVGGDMFVYYEEGNPRASVVPNVFVAIGAVKDELREGGWRETYKLWEEPKGPDFVLEVTSRSTQREDQMRKRALYARLGVTECFLYDPKGEYLPPLQGMRLRGGGYERLAPVRLPDGREGLWSGVLGLYLCSEGQALRVHDPVAGRDLLTPDEEAAAGREEAAARQAAEARLAELVAARREEAAARQDAEARAAEETAARQAAEVRVAEEAAARREEAAARREEAAARRAAEARVAELEALLSTGGVPVPPVKG